MSAVAGRRRVPVWLGVGVVVLAVVGGGGTWLLRGELFHPFGDARACAGSDLKLPGAITAGGATIPADATDVHVLFRAVLLVEQGLSLREDARTVQVVLRPPARERDLGAAVPCVSTLYDDAFRVPARVVVGYTTP